MRLIPLLILLLVPVRGAIATDGPARLPFAAPEAGQESYRLVDQKGSGPDQAAVEIHGEAGQTLTTIVQVDNPPVASHQYVVRGRVKYEDVAGTAYLEMWSDFGAQGAHFSRTLGEVGPMRLITGTSNWRDIELPFFAEPGMRPARITINVVMPGKGTIQLSPLTLQSLDSASAWWTPPQGGLVGGIGGSVLGILGGAIGFLASRRRGRTVVMSLIATGLACGACFLVAGVIALCLRQPFFVVYPLLLLGGITTVVLGFNAPTILRRYREEELRKMAALDA